MKSMEKLTRFSEEEVTFDKQHLWHPYTSLSNPLPVYPVASASGTKIKLDDGTILIDGMSSWWSTIHGYNHPALNEVVTKQLQHMSHVMFGGFTHKPAIKLGQKLCSLTPKELNKVFFCDSGSVSVEVAMKMAIQYQHAKDKKEKSAFMTLAKGYHGDTTGAMSVCDPVSGMHHLFSDFVPQHFFLKEPQNGFDIKLKEQTKKELEHFFVLHHKKSAAFILEPIVQGAGGMRIYSPEYLNHIAKLCKKYDLLLIADEIATGFGRTGKMFAIEHANVIPDILCVGKALTGGYMTLAATISTEYVALTISKGDAGVMMHGPTFMANPLACAVALKNLELLTNYSWQTEVNRIEKQLKKQLIHALKHKQVKDIRILGAIGVIETHQTVNTAKIQAFFVSRGVWIRPFRNLVYIMPPYIISNQELIQLCHVICEALNHKEFFQP